MSGSEIKIPDIGDFADVEVIEIHVKAGDEIAIDDPLITIETDKAAMDVPATEAGKVAELRVSTGDKVSEGDVILVMDASAAKGRKPADEPPHDATVVMDPKDKERVLEESARIAVPSAAELEAAGNATHKAEIVVIGSGPGGYTAAFRAADLGADVILIERYASLGGVCLNVGCIPSKALLHAAKVVDEAAEMAEHGIRFGAPEIDAGKLNDWKGSVVERLTGGIEKLAKARKVRVLHATAQFASPNRLQLDNGDSVDFERCIIAAGSQSAMLPGLPDDPRIVDSTGALQIDPLPASMLVVGGGIIGLEMACVYSAMGVKVSVVELTDQLMPGTDPDLVRPFQKVIKGRYEKILLSTKVTGMVARDDGIEVSFEGDSAPEPERYDRVLVAIGRRANGDKLAAEKAGVTVDERGIIPVDKQMKTNVPHIFAIGDLAGGPMLAHKATHEAKVAAEVAVGMKSAFDARTIPSVAYTDPEVAWVGLTETEAKRTGVNYEKAQFPWAASGRALSLGRDEGFTKLLFDPSNGRVLGGGIVGPSAGDLIAEIGLAVEMGADATDVGLTVHPHPTLSETVAFAAEAFEGTLTDLYLPKKKR